MFTIVVPVKAINDYVRETVPYIQALERDDWELIILPNDDDPNEWADDPRISILPSGRVGPADKRDMAARVANGDVLVFLDDDSYPNADLLSLAAREFERHPVAALGGPASTPPSDSFKQRVSGAAFLSRLTGGAPERYVPVGEPRDVDDWPSVNLMVKKDAFLAVGGFDCKYWPGEDTRLCLKLVEAGYTIRYVPEMVVWHHRREGYLRHLKQVGGYGMHRGHFARHYPATSMRPQYLVPSAVSTMAAFTVLSWALPRWMRKVLALGWFLYLGVIAVGIAEIARREDKRVAVAAAPYVIGSHLFYGVQFVRGYFKQGELVGTLR